ncbi:LysR substrate-binding domain-containing protein [Flexibacterium corallicola]|uniref:LysR substrate-binding domain-containing protein n=1 Tax=Flexibacterium corallicola TaxID=3037259 RepID=UPI00286F088D|nr:LysR substrate-binding domain-containing protein [Pseudovibrio sp. M1P-2-3]
MKNLNQVSLVGLRAIEAVGRLGTLKAAAGELGITVGAVSQQVQKTEGQLGRSLFERQSSGLKLTEHGKKVCAELTKGMRSLSEAIALSDRDRKETLFISAPPVLAEKWLVWRLKGFLDKYPEINVRLEAARDLVDVSNVDIDACIRIAAQIDENLHREKLRANYIFPVCSPMVARQLQSLEDLRKVPIIYDTNRMFDWNLWLEPFQLDQKDLARGLELSNASLCLDAAIAGQGVFLGWETLAFDAIERGAVVVPFEHRADSGLSYWFLTRDETRKTTSVRRFKEWLFEQFQRDFGDVT